MSASLAGLWQLHTEFTLLLCFTLLARYVIRKQKQNHQAYLIWLCLPLGLLGAYAVSLFISNTQSLPVNSQLLQQYLRQPVENLSQIPAPSSTDIIAWTWLLIALMTLGRLLVQHLKLRQSLRAISRGRNHTLSSRYPIVTVDSNHLSPAVYGFIQPKIYLPLQVQNKLSRQQLRLITRHEEQHIRQGHLWLNLMWDLLVCLLWFNPLVYLARQQFRHDQELYCDYIVLNAQDEDSSRSYGHALLTTVTATHSVSLLCSWNAFNQLEERIMNIKSASQKSGKGLLLVATLAIFSATSLYAIGGQEEKTERKEVRKEVMIHKGDGSDEKKLVKIRKNDIEFIEENGQRYVVENGDKREMTEAESKEFDVETLEVDKYVKGGFDHEGGHKMIHIEKDHPHGDHGEVTKHIKIIKDDKVFEQRDGELFIIENEEKRSATAEEISEFEKEMEAAHQHIREVKIERELELMRQEVEIKKELEVMRHRESEVDELSLWLESEAHEFERYNAEFERAAAALKEFDMQSFLSEAELDRHRESLVAARESLQFDEEKMRRSLETAQAQLEKFHQGWEVEKKLSQPH